MLSRNQYQGRLPYEEYIKRFKQSQEITADLKKNVKEQINKQIEQGKDTLSKKFNDEMKKRGIDTSKVEEMANILKDKGKLNDKQRNALYTGFILSKAGKPTSISILSASSLKFFLSKLFAETPPAIIILSEMFFFA